jgi:hypothetical protein
MIADLTTRLIWMVNASLLSCILAGLLAAQPTLRITSPNDATVVHPGQSLTVIVAASPPGSFQQVVIVAWDPIGGSLPLKAPPYQFTVQIPNEIDPGEYLITAHGATEPGHDIRSNSIRIVVERADLPLSLRVEPSLLRISTGQKGYLRVIGVFGDGTTTDLTKSSRTIYTSDKVSVATVQAQGIVTAVTAGSAIVLVANGNAKSEVPVRVAGNNPR